ncbi:MAG: 50S ribosomal protein L11 methyltransferase, partial [Oscillospiraceae bacterium]|nr:50S ribosomal protein L11 methyltransferase [Oscillospiraceae bacterium]
FSSRPAPDPSGEQGDCKKTQAASGFEPESGRRLADGVTVLDVGCGSGILAVAAILLGAKFAFGTDIDLKAVETAIENAALNNVSEKTKFIAGDLAGHTTQAYDIVCANISADTIIKFLPEAPKLLKSEGSLILSGIIKDRTQDVLDAVSLAGLEVKQQTEENGWVCMVAHYKRIKSYAQARSKHRR